MKILRTTIYVSQFLQFPTSTSLRNSFDIPACSQSQSTIRVPCLLTNSSASKSRPLDPLACVPSSSESPTFPNSHHASRPINVGKGHPTGLTGLSSHSPSDPFVIAWPKLCHGQSTLFRLQFALLPKILVTSLASLSTQIH